MRGATSFPVICALFCVAFLSLPSSVAANRFLETLSGPCDHTFSDGSFFNLKPLVRTPGRNDYVSEDAEKRMYYLNICANVQQIPNECRVLGKLMSSPGYLVKNDSQCFWLGSVTEYEWELIDATDPKLGVSLRYFNGERCAPGAYRQLQFRFFCDPLGEMGSVGDYLVEEIEELCLYRVTFPTKFGCPQKAKWSASWTFVFMFTFSIVAYLLIGCGINVVRNNRQWGVDALPNREFWEEVPTLVREGIAYTTARIQGLTSSQSSQFEAVGSANSISEKEFQDLEQSYEWG